MRKQAKSCREAGNQRQGWRKLAFVSGCSELLWLCSKTLKKLPSWRAETNNYQCYFRSGYGSAGASGGSYPEGGRLPGAGDRAPIAGFQRTPG
jgi:hypothetical protein